MAERRSGERTGSPVRLPLTLLLLFLAGLAGTLIWLTVASPGYKHTRPLTGPRVDIEIGIPPAAPEAKTAAAAEAVRPPPATDAPPPPEAPPEAPPETPALPENAAIPPPMPKLPPVTERMPLSTGADPALIEAGPTGPLPVIAPDGRLPWRVYARPFDRADKRPRIAVVIYGLGLSDAATQTAIQGLPGQITLAFVPYADRLESWVRQARAAGHEVLLSVPMEPVNFPQEDPGPQALLTSLTPAENLRRLDWTLGRATGYVGVTDFMGSRFTATRKQMRAVLEALKRRGLMFLDSHSAPDSAVGDIAGQIGLPWANNLAFLDAKASRAAIDSRLEDIERIARRDGRAIAMGYPYPVTLERIANWAQREEARGFVLAPVTAMVTQTAEP